MLTKKEAQDIVDALLFSSTCDICADWERPRYAQFAKLAKKVADEFKVDPSKDIYLFGSGIYEEKHSAGLKKIFPKLRVKE